MRLTHASIITVLVLSGCAATPPPPPEPDPTPRPQIATPRLTPPHARVGAPGPEKEPDPDIKSIQQVFQDASDKALIYVGAPTIDKDTLTEMRSLYVEAGRAMTSLKTKKRGADYGSAREAVNALSDYVNAHPPKPVEPSP